MRPEGQVYPLELSRIFVRKVWGSRSLGTALGLEIENLPSIGELWETFDGREQGSIVLNGRHRLTPLRDIVREMGTDLLGTRLAEYVDQPFPLLIKYLFPSQALSVQVHPDDAYALRVEHCLGKTEMWIVLTTYPDSFIFMGWKPGFDRRQIVEALKKGPLDAVIRRIRPKVGEVYLVPAGTVHALGPGVGVMELQQHSHITYRIHDWDRPGEDGKPRELHFDKALEVLDYEYRPNYRIEPLSVTDGHNTFVYMCACRYFAACRWILERPLELNSDPARFWVLSVIDGGGVLHYGGGETVVLERTSVVVIPAAMGSFRIEPLPRLELIKSWIPDLAADIVAPLRRAGFSTQRIAALGGQGRGNDLLAIA
ncbi:MAG: type I phosphomannose isomerase catalytic subunit [Thermodesulfobacteriota bacterium]